MKRIVIAPLFLVAAALSASAFAAPQCTSAPRAQWLTEAAMKQKVLDQGYTIKVFQVTGNCYEIYGKDKAGNKVEIYFDPTDGHIVKKKGG
ncbi:PepSY domain-containing protein [Rhodanobacter soli]|uniref:PepSY domain-containing protein n=1 Tax=Rhodanobacter soli TaxID=590609 RepID=UPI0031D3779A